MKRGVGKTSSIIEGFRPFTNIVPQIPKTDRLPLRERALWTLGCLAVYLAASQIPLFGITKASSADPLYWVRMIVASNKGTLMELGVTPLITSSMMTQILSNIDFLGYDSSKRDHRILLKKIEKLFGVIVTILQATVYVMSGMYGPLAEIGPFKGICIVLQLTFSGLLLILMDDMLCSGYGIASNGDASGGINLFIACNVCERIMWRAFSPMTYRTSYGDTIVEGAVLAAFHSLLFSPNKYYALRDAFFRSSGPNLFNLISTIGLFVLVIFLQGFRVELPIHSSRVRGVTSSYPIRLFYTSAIPIVLQTAVVANLYVVSQAVHALWPNSFFSLILGRWGSEDAFNDFVPKTGLAYYASPPLSLIRVLHDPLHALVYTTIVLTTCFLFGRIWLSISGGGPEDLAAQLRSQGFVIKGYRESTMAAVLNRYIPPAAAFGGAAVGGITVLADILGTIGSGTSILLAVNIIHGYFESIIKETYNMGRVNY